MKIDFVAQSANFFYFNHDCITILHKDLRITEDADPVWGAGGDQVAGLKGEGMG